MMLPRTLSLVSSLATSLLAAAFWPQRLVAREIFVAAPAQLSAALQAARAGDVLTLKNGGWTDTRIVVGHGGEPGQPVELRAESPGGVILNGASLLEINAPYVTVSGLLFRGGAISRGSVIQFNSHHGVVRDTAVVDYNPPSFDTKYYWVFFQGDHNLVDRCYFKGKNHLEPVIGNGLEDSRHNRVAHSLFRDIPAASANGREIIRVWGSGKYEGRDDDGAFFTIEGNLFDHADGEGAEIISLKSNHNVVQNNTVVATLGCINIRRGNFNTVRNNLILGQGRSGAKGFRMSGEHNLVQGNLAAGCEYGIQVSCGEFIADSLTSGFQPNVKTKNISKQQARVPTYPQNRDVRILDNIMIGNSGPDLEIGSDFKKHWPESQQVLLPEACLIRGNRLVRPAGGTSVVGTMPETTPPLNRFTFAPNRYEENLLVGGKCAFPPAAAGFASREPAPDWSLAREIAALRPLTPNEVGPAWLTARREAGDHSLEGPAAASPAGASKPAKKKKSKAG